MPSWLFLSFTAGTPGFRGHYTYTATLYYLSCMCLDGKAAISTLMICILTYESRTRSYDFWQAQKLSMASSTYQARPSGG
ncbi:hypothetical protein BDV25DRAFT_151673 [Aspergillus avenaceus]|uniref:Uncharacterized protein n=1 Tax=Aspergillus avenaceus TaxID=36643 RepID=A0A5N6U0S0_ASPAV|nr:hypothetical protein BDV25DRAFT_151673 [Aspergillus avenaceus]